MSVSIQSVTYSGLHSVSRHARHRDGSLDCSNSAVKRSTLVPHFAVSRDQNEYDGCSTVNYGANEKQWMNGCYMDLRLRSNSLFNAEASLALHQHFRHDDETSSSSHHDTTTEQDSRSRTDQSVTRQPPQGGSYALSDLVVFDKSMFGQLDGRSFTQQYGHLVNGFNSGVTSFMDEPFC